MNTNSNFIFLAENFAKWYVQALKMEDLMSEEKNVGQFDSVIRLILGFGIVGLVASHFIGDRFIPIYGFIPIIILIPYLLKTGFTKVCPIMKAMNVSTIRRDEG